jgi:hypothetical protein
VPTVRRCLGSGGYVSNGMEVCVCGRACNDNEHEKMCIIVRNYKEADT